LKFEASFLFHGSVAADGSLQQDPNPQDSD